MFKVPKIPSDKTVAIVSDLHIGHDKEFLYGKRGFKNIREHDEWIFDELNALSSQGNVVLMNLGDACLTRDQQANFDRLSRLPFDEHYFLWGNHNAGAKDAYNTGLSELGFLSGEQVYPWEYNSITFVGDSLSFRRAGLTFFCSHFAHFIWDRSHHGVIHLCGHSHGSCKDLNAPPSHIGKVLDCGVENAQAHWGKPYFLLSGVIDIIEHKSIIQKDHHNAFTN